MASDLDRLLNSRVKEKGIRGTIESGKEGNYVVSTSSGPLLVYSPIHYNRGQSVLVVGNSIKGATLTPSSAPEEAVV